jgi:O-methyltransferase
MNQSPAPSWRARTASPDHWFGRALLSLRAAFELAAWRPAGADDRALKTAVARVMPAFTMVAVARLRQLAAHAGLLHDERIAGAIVECGTWKGGSLALIDWACRRRGEVREVWGFDSFEGLPPPGDLDPESAHRGFFQGWCAATPADVRLAIGALGGRPERARLVAGWLADTLPASETGPIALLNVDVDWYESVTTVLDDLVGRVTPGGIVNIDDYGRWEGCDRAVHDFLARRRWARTIIQRTGRHGAWFRVPAS